MSATFTARARLGARAYCTRAGSFTHLDGEGRARMVDVGDKEPTRRVAVAACELHVSARLLRLLRDARLPKGDALTVAQVAGALGAKRTSDLLPMCHALALDAVRVRVSLPRGDCPGGGAVLLQCEVRARAPTGVEMEALTGVAVAALALYDMCKSVDRAMRIGDLRLLHKSGGRSDGTAPPPPPPPPVRPLGAEPRPPRDTEGETYAPTDVAHF